ncbi:MAG: patatin-like phospholipase family protein [Bacillota bacterium]
MYKKLIIFILLILLLYSLPVLAENTYTNKVFYDIENTYIIEKSDNFSFEKKPTIALALGGGGARALVNIGVIDILHKNNIPIDMVVGTSMGAVIAAMYGSGISPDEMEDIVSSNIFSSLFDFNFLFTYSLLESKKLNNFIELAAPEKNLEDFRLPTAILSMNLSREQKYIHTTGKISDVIQCSYAIPFIFPIKFYNDEYFVDPGIKELTPALAAKIMGADFIISTMANDEMPYDIFNLPHRGWMRTINIIKSENSNLITRKYSDIIIEHFVGDYSFMDFQLADDFIELGRKETLLKIDEIKALINRRKIYSYDHKNNNYIKNIIEDAKNERIIYNQAIYKPYFSYGKKEDYMINSLFNNNSTDIEFGFELSYKNLDLNWIQEYNSFDNQFKIKYKKINDALDLITIYNENDSKENLKIYVKNYSLNLNTGIGVAKFNNDVFLNILNEYNKSFNNFYNVFLRVKTDNYFSFDNNKSKYLIEGEVEIPVKENWDFTNKFSIQNFNYYFKPEIYRGTLRKEKISTILVSSELGYNKYFKYSKEVLVAFQMLGYRAYGFIDSEHFENFRYGSGLETKIRVMGVKPIHFGINLSNDFKNKEPEISLDFNIKF